MRILIVEDERQLVEVLTAILETKGYYADAAFDGVDALEYAGRYRYDLIVLDVMLPELDGFSVLRELRRRGDQTPVLMLTARVATRDKVDGLNAGADDYLTKPFETEELLARVNALTRRRGSIVPRVLTYGTLTLDMDSGVMGCGEKTVQLSRREFEVAKQFLLCPETILTKAALLDRVWGSGSDTLENNVEAYISFLRKKLRFLDSGVTIRNVQKFGYRMEGERC